MLVSSCLKLLLRIAFSCVEFYGKLRLESNNPDMLDFAYEPELISPTVPFFSPLPLHQCIHKLMGFSVVVVMSEV